MITADTSLVVMATETELTDDSDDSMADMKRQLDKWSDGVNIVAVSRLKIWLDVSFRVSLDSRVPRCWRFSLSLTSPFVFCLLAHLALFGRWIVDFHFISLTSARTTPKPMHKGSRRV